LSVNSKRLVATVDAVVIESRDKWDVLISVKDLQMFFGKDGCDACCTIIT
jgi:hypothetical protein